MLFLAGFALVMLQGRQMAENNLGLGSARWAGVDWRPVVIGAEPVAEERGLHVRFAADGSISGSAGCNDFFGSLEQKENGFAVGPLGATRKACEPETMRIEATFLQALQMTTSINAGEGTLQLLGAEDALLAELRAVSSSD